MYGSISLFEVVFGSGAGGKKIDQKSGITEPSLHVWCAARVARTKNISTQAAVRASRVERGTSKILWLSRERPPTDYYVVVRRPSRPSHARTRTHGSTIASELAIYLHSTFLSCM